MHRYICLTPIVYFLTISLESHPKWWVVSVCLCWHKSLLIYKTFLFLMGNKNFFNLRQITVKTCLEYKLARADNFFAVPKLSIIVWLQRLQKALRKTVNKNLIQRPALCKKKSLFKPCPNSNCRSFGLDLTLLGMGRLLTIVTTGSQLWNNH